VGVVVRVPATSANLGAGFDALGMALTLYAELGTRERGDDVPDGAHIADRHHPADIAFRALGGAGELWVRSPIPMGRGLGYSGAIRVGGAAVAVIQRDGALDAAGRAEVFELTAELERHPDNVAASVYGGVIVAVGRQVAPVQLGFESMVVVWVPNSTSTSTDESRAALPDYVSRADAVFNVGRAALFVAACAAGDVAALATATDDRLHQPVRLAAVPESASAIETARLAGAWAAWLSGSGPTIAALCDPAVADTVAAALPSTGHTKLLQIDRAGVIEC
jgi:homoserine kinase